MKYLMLAINSPIYRTVGPLVAGLVLAFVRPVALQERPTLTVTKEFVVEEPRSKEMRDLAARVVRDFWEALAKPDLDAAAELCSVPFAFDRKEIAVDVDGLRALLGKVKRLPPLSEKAVLEVEEQKRVILRNCVPLDFVVVSVSPEGSNKKVEFAVTVGKTAHVAGFSD